MKCIDFYYDPVSPYAYLAFVELPKALADLSFEIHYRPAFLGGILKHWGQLAPAEIAPKREWTFRQMLWVAAQKGIDLQLPSVHPFNSLPLLRLALACAYQDETGCHTNRYQTQLLLEHVWLSGGDPLDAPRMKQLADYLGVNASPDEALAAKLKEQLRAQTQTAIDQGVFGMPAFVVDNTLFWGLDSLPMLRSFVQGMELLPPELWNAAKQIPSAVPTRASPATTNQ